MVYLYHRNWQKLPIRTFFERAGSPASHCPAPMKREGNVTETPLMPSHSCHVYCLQGAELGTGYWTRCRRYFPSAKGCTPYPMPVCCTCTSQVGRWLGSCWWVVSGRGRLWCLCSRGHVVFCCESVWNGIWAPGGYPNHMNPAGVFWGFSFEEEEAIAASGT